ncbi:leucyl aminopeptidase family protein [Amorphus orientalis]|uniref:Leucyl aminopeptidase n=1 Tax=Amorphus orientalis TaxID=649198 RepID=A0AAE3VSI6_9HYPH|nr:leucyl aminopeptidase family protein [Amorphus orientalis]MDQ0317378.1 leucyl aminopeptidase [Amorphus orientalis]
MDTCLVDQAGEAGAIPVYAATTATLDGVIESLPSPMSEWARANDFKASAGSVLACPDAGGRVVVALLGLGAPDAVEPFAAAALHKLPAGSYRLQDGFDDPATSVLGFALSSYRFGRYTEAKPSGVKLVLPAEVDRDEMIRIIEAATLTRDLVNTPANDLGPDELAAAARTLSERYAASFSVIEGDALREGFPMIHAVGQASPRAPRLIDLQWGPEDAPKVTLVGKGVVFDTGGLDIKPPSSMLLMKKDMGGAAHALGLALMVMDAGLPVRLRVLIPAVENAISGNAFRPGDVLRSRKGLSVEIGNTDAEGRLILADALALADEETPDLLIDFATLTGAARVALGPELPALFTPDDDLAASILRHGEAVDDPLWRLPLWPGYRAWIKSEVADVNHISSQPLAGAITAALFLEKFVEKAPSWAHIDLFAWSSSDRPGYPKGGAAQTIRALYSLLKDRVEART